MKGFTWNSKAVLQFFQKNRWTALLLLVGLALLLWPAGGTGDNNTPAATEQRQQYAYDLESLEEKLANTLSQVEGAGRTQVVLTLATTGSVELAENQTSKDGSVETQVVVVKRGSNQEDVVEVAQQYPAFLGALVVSNGGGDPQVKLDLLQAVYLNWSYDQGQSVSGMGSAAANVTSERNLGEAALVNSDGALGLEEGSASSSAAASPKTDDKTAQKNKDAKTTSDDYFATARVNREEARDNSLSILQKTVNDPKASKDAVDAASKSITAMASATLQESKIESLVTAKGYTDCVAFIGDNSVSVVVKAKNNALKASDVAKITDIVVGETKFSAGDVKVISSSQQ